MGLSWSSSTQAMARMVDVVDETMVVVKRDQVMMWLIDKQGQFLCRSLKRRQVYNDPGSNPSPSPLPLQLSHGCYLPSPKSQIHPPQPPHFPTTMSFSLQPRQVTFGRSVAVPQQQYQPSQPQPYPTQPQPTQANGLALPYSANSYLPGPSTGLALPGPVPTVPTFQSQPQPTQPPPQVQPQPTQSPPVANGSHSPIVAGPSTPAPTAVPATPAPLTLEQQHITAVEGIVPTLQNIVATVNLDCRLDLKTIALHARNAEYNPKVGIISVCS